MTITDRPSDWSDDTDLPSLAIGSGLPSVAVAIEYGDTEVSICGCLVDTCCQGVKNAVGPNIVDRGGLSASVAEMFAAYDQPPLPVPITLAQELVLGAVDYARTPGFDPHRDFYQAKAHLGAWRAPGRIQFGYHGKPYFQPGPYDNAERIMRTLDCAVGAGNYGFNASTATPVITIEHT